MVCCSVTYNLCRLSANHHIVLLRGYIECQEIMKILKQENNLHKK